MRIIAGAFRGRRLVAPKGLATRPTTDRVREAWFSILGPIEGTVLDLYAGTGALGLEALSRGADHAVFVENSRKAIEALERNAEVLEVRDRISLIRLSVEACAGAVHRLAPFSLIVTDPPWTALEASERALSRLLHAKLLMSGGRLVLGHPKNRPLPLPATTSLTLTQTRSWGDSAASFFEPTEPTEQEPGERRLDSNSLPRQRDRTKQQ